MILYAYASCILGWSSMPRLAQMLLGLRGLSGSVDGRLRFTAVSTCALGACCAWVFLPGALACLAFSFACVCMAGLFICDLREHVLPTELVAVFFALSVVFRLAVGAVDELVALGIPAALLAALLLAANALLRRRGADELLGSGDIRMLLPLVLFCGKTGIAYGVFAGAIAIGALALFHLLFEKASGKTAIALAPGLAVWLFVGTLIPFA